MPLLDHFQLPLQEDCPFELEASYGQARQRSQL
jgi:hypothetical protein